MKYFVIGWLLLVIPIWYWMLVVTVSTDYRNTGNDFGRKALQYNLEGKSHEFDSCWGMFLSHIEKADKIQKQWLPKFARTTKKEYQWLKKPTFE